MISKIITLDKYYFLLCLVWKKTKKISINATRSILYTIAKLLGDLNAIQKGRVEEGWKKSCR